MKNECSIVRDLLPLYAEDMLSPETSEFVAEHLKGCDGCREEFERTKELESAHCDVSDAAPLKPNSRQLCMMPSPKASVPTAAMNLTLSPKRLRL